MFTEPHRCPRARRAAPRHQRGVAVITALVVVAAATVAIAGMLWRQSVAVRKVENQAALSQSRWLARGAVDWVRVVLREDARISQADHLAELWAVPLAPTRVGPNGVVSTDAGDPNTALISGRVRDAQARFNLTNLVVIPVGSAVGTITTTPGAALGAAETAAAAASVVGTRSGAAVAAGTPGPEAAGGDAGGASGGAGTMGTTGGKPGTPAPPANLTEVAVLERLLVIVGQAPDAAARLARAVGLRMNEAPRPAALEDFAPLLGDDLQEALRPHVAILPRATPVNVNTAGAEVLSARFDNLPLERARALVDSRQRVWFNQISDVLNRMPGMPLTTAPNSIAVASSFFEVEGEVRQGRVDLQVRAALERGNGGATRILEMREL